MKYLPTENIIYKTRLTVNEVFTRLEENVEPAKRFGLVGGTVTKNYEGEILPPTFSIKRIIRYQNSFLPKIKGTVEQDFGGTRIHVTMRLPASVAIFMVIWFAGAVVGCGIILTLGSGGSWWGLIPFVLLLFGYGLTMGGFKMESISSKKEFKKLFEAEVIKG